MNDILSKHNTYIENRSRDFPMSMRNVSQSPRVSGQGQADSLRLRPGGQAKHHLIPNEALHINLHTYVVRSLLFYILSARMT